MHRTQLFFPEELHQELKDEAKKQKVSVSQLVRDIVEDYLRHSHRKHTEQGIQTLLKISER